jgi:hypothetical protein
MRQFPYLQTSAFTAYIADNAPLGIHRRGYNGVASLIPRHSGNNLFVPTYAGLNYETISLAGMPAYRYEPRKEEHQSIFEPRCEPMHVESADAERVVLVQPETAHSGVSARITFRVEEPHYLHQRIELTFHRRFCVPGEPNRFRSLWASYLHMPPDVHVYLKPDWPSGDDLAGWLGVVKADHRAPVEFCPLPDGELDVQGHLAAVEHQLPRSMPQVPDGPLAFYYGFCHGSLALLKMFKQPEQFKLAYSPCGGGTEPALSPAWDYVLHLDDAQLDRAYSWDLCLVVKDYRGRADILDEVRRYVGS